MLSILIVNWNTRELLRACLSSLYAHPPSDSFEIIVVDNASSDNSAEMVSADFPDVTLVASPVNTGYAKGNNIAFEKASGEFLLTLNPDTEIFDEALNVAINRLQANPRHGCLGIKLIHPDGRVQSSVRGFPTLIGIIGQVFGGKLSESYRLTQFDYDKEQTAPQPMGTFLLFRREALAAVGDVKHPFDEGFPIFFNEVDLLLRLDRAGWPTLYTPMASIVHHGGESTKQVRKSMIWESHRSLMRFLRKHELVGWKRVLAPGVAMMLNAAAFVRAKGYDAGFRT